MPQSLEKTMLDKVSKAKEGTQKKLFKQFVLAKTDEDRNNIGAQMKALDALVFEFTKAIREIE